MTYVRRVSVTVTTDGSGDATAYSEPIDFGLLSQIRYVKPGAGNFDNGVDFNITLEATGETLWAENDVNASATRAPRQAVHTTAGVAATYDGTRATLDKIAIAGDRIKVVVASGGAAKTGAFHFLIG